MTLDNDQEVKIQCFEIFNKAIDINKKVPKETINMLLNIGAAYTYDIGLLKIIHHCIQKSKSYDEKALMSYIDNVLLIKDYNLTIECLNLLELAIHSCKTLK